METHKKFKLEQHALRLFIFLIGIALCVYCGMLCIGVKHVVAEVIVVTFGYALLGLNVWAFKLCWVAWMFLLYIYSIRICMVLADVNFFGEYLDLAHYIAFSVGVCLIILLCFKIKTCNRNEDDDTAPYSEDSTKNR